jgi:ABC-2 type transport system permease protein
MTAVTARAAAPIRWRLTWATARRVLTQLRHDPRTVVVLIAVPSVLMILLRYVLDNPPALNRFAPEFIGVFPFIVMFIVAAVTTQRERVRGTLERLMAMPLGKLDLLAGYAIAFGLVACLQVGVVLLISLTWLGVQLPGSVAPLAVVAILDALLGMALGLFASAFARDRVPGRPVHARLRPAAGAAMRDRRGPQPDDRRAALAGGALTLRRRTR